MNRVQTYRDLFIHRPDRWSQQQPNGSYLSTRRPVTEQIVRAHLGGQLTAGWYQLRPEDDTVIWACLDADAEDGLAQVRRTAAYLSEFGIAMPIEDSRRGAHGWLFFERPLKASSVKKVLERLMAHLGLDDVEVFPKQGQLNGDGCGSLVRGPLGVHRKSGQAYFFLEAPPNAVDQIRYLAEVRKTSADDLRALWRALPKPACPRPVVQPQGHSGRRGNGNGNGIIGRINQAILAKHGSLSGLIGQFVALDPQGRGLCPWHNDEVASFRVNDRTGRWICFACPPLPGSHSDYCTGDAFEFIAHYLYDDDKRRAVRELANRYGL
jgi:hypothetical protein